MKMNRTPGLLQSLFAMLLSMAFVCPAISQDDWSRWRGPNGDGIASDDQKPPVTWSEDENIIWKAKIPGRGHASPIVVGNRILLSTADEKEQTQSVVCFDRQSGKMLWETLVNQENFPARIHPNNTHASSTIATDGKHAFAVFHNRQGVYVTALNLEGKKVWEKRVGAFEPHYPFGYGASPIVHRDKVIVTSQGKAESAIVAYRCGSGELVWRCDCKNITNYSTPVVAKFKDRELMLLSGQRMVAAYNPEDGTKLWDCPAKWDVTCATMVWDDENVYASGGYPAPQTLAVKADGSGTKIWENNQKSYEQSMLLHEGYLYTNTDSGVVYCWRAKDGQEMWKERFRSGSNVGQSCSPVLANGNIYITAQNGETLVFAANPKKLEIVARNQLGAEGFPTMAVCGSQLFIRTASYEDGDRTKRQEWLYCVGEKPE
jgi:outer membrane protein assembly factor BamB